MHSGRQTALPPGRARGRGPGGQKGRGTARVQTQKAAGCRGRGAAEGAPCVAGAGPPTHRSRRQGSGTYAPRRPLPEARPTFLSLLRIDHMKAGRRQVLSAATKECPPQNKGQEPLRRGRSRLARSQPPMLRREPRRGVHPPSPPRSPEEAARRQMNLSEVPEKVTGGGARGFPRGRLQPPGREEGGTGQKGCLRHEPPEDWWGSRRPAAGPGCGSARGRTERDDRKESRKPSPVPRVRSPAPLPRSTARTPKSNTHVSSCLPKGLLSGEPATGRKKKKSKSEKVT